MIVQGNYIRETEEQKSGEDRRETEEEKSSEK